MRCPRDGAALEKHHQAKLELDRCPTCKGLWCDAEELARLAGTATDLPAGAPGLDGLSAECPRCQGSMTRRVTRAVVVDCCPACQGVWLDENELKQIILSAHGLG